MKNILLILLGIIVLAGCQREADVASRNLSTAADQFQIDRRIVFLNGITDSYILQVEGRCSIGNTDKVGRLSVTCKVGPSEYKKHFLGLSDNVTFFAEQLGAATVSKYRYKVIFRPTTIIPDVDLEN